MGPVGLRKVASSNLAPASLILTLNTSRFCGLKHRYGTRPPKELGKSMYRNFLNKCLP